MRFTKSFGEGISLNMHLDFVVHYMCVLAPEAVTELDYEQDYGSDNLIKIIIKWMVSLLSKS